MEKRFMKKLVSILCAFALVFSLAGCGQEEKKPEKKVTITIVAAASLEKTLKKHLFLVLKRNIQM